jgi:hypothetical protein
MTSAGWIAAAGVAALCTPLLYAMLRCKHSDDRWTAGLVLVVVAFIGGLFTWNINDNDSFGQRCHAQHGQVSGVSFIYCIREGKIIAHDP